MTVNFPNVEALSEVLGANSFLPLIDEVDVTNLPEGMTYLGGAIVSSAELSNVTATVFGEQVPQDALKGLDDAAAYNQQNLEEAVTRISTLSTLRFPYAGMTLANGTKCLTLYPMPPNFFRSLRNSRRGQSSAPFDAETVVNAVLPFAQPWRSVVPGA